MRDRFLDASYDLIIAEGWKSEGYPKIVVIREQVGEIPFSSEGLLAVVSDKPMDLDVPVLISTTCGGGRVAHAAVSSQTCRAEHELEV